MAHVDIPFVCPYCGEEFAACRPVDIVRARDSEPDLDKSLVTTEKKELPLPFEIKCLPYTRDFDRFDPKPNQVDPHLDPSGWSRIGSDFLKFLNFEIIGILRQTGHGLNVRYRVARCINCQRLFDVFLNYTPEKTFSQIWPHLFGEDPDHHDEIAQYHGVSIVLDFIHRLGSRLNSMHLAIIIFGLILFFLAVSPWILVSFFQLGNLAEIQPFLLSGPQKFLFYLIATAGICVMLALEEQYLNYMDKTRDFYDLLDVRDKETGITFWRNYIICRFTGVQTPHKQVTISQVDVFGGGLAIALLLVTWIVNLQNAADAWWILVIIIGITIVFVSQSFHNWHSRLRFIAAATAVILAGLSIKYFLNGPEDFWRSIFIGFDLAFWVCMAYFFGTAAILGMNTALYVIRGLTRIPMKLNVYNEFALSKPLRRVQNFSSEILLALFLSVLSLVSIILVLQQSNVFLSSMQWLFEFLRWAVALIFAGIGFGSGNKWYFFVAAIYGLLSILLGQIIYVARDLFHINIVASPIIQYMPILLLGAFFTVLIGYQIAQIDGLISNILKTFKDNELNELDETISGLMQKIKYFGKVDQEKAEEATDPGLLVSVQTIEGLLTLKERLEKVQVTQHFQRRAAEFLAPVLSSIIFPFVVNAISKLII